MAVVAVAYGSAAPQLAVAEFAPSAQQQPQAPPTTAAATADAGGTSGRRATTTTMPVGATTTAPEGPASSAPTTQVGRARRCFGNPPRQTEDLLAPACLPTIFEGDNGGATSRGVTATEIRVGIPVSGGFATGANPRRDTLTALFEYFSRQFELYGRRLVPVFVEGSTSDALANRTLGAQVAAASVFGALTGPIELTGYYPQPSLPQELARNEVVTVTQNRVTWWSDRTMFDPLHPFLWSVYPSAEAQLANLGSVACALAGKLATHTADPDVVGKSRHFGILSMGRQQAPVASALEQELEGCTGRSPGRINWTALSASNSSDLRTGMANFAASGVTTIVCVCEYVWFDTAMSEGDSQQFDPEWILPTSNYSGGEEYVGQVLSQYHGVKPVEVQAGPRVASVQASPWFQAVLSANPALLSGSASVVGEVFSMAEFAYDQMLVLAAGIQAAGPTLTPATFAAGLLSAQFPNPGAGQAPAWQPLVGFGPGDHSFYDGFAVAWWSDRAQALSPHVYGTGGSWCYVGAGTRFQPGTVPADLDDLLFRDELPCR